METGGAAGQQTGELRAFGHGDLVALTELCRRTIDTSYAGVYPPAAIAHFKQHHRRSEIAKDAEEGTTLVWERDGRLLATGTLVGNEIRRLFVEPACQRQGLGRAVMAALEGRARERGVSRVELYASLVAIPFYRTLGYETLEEADFEVEDGERLRYARMAKPLGAAPGRERPG